MRAVVLMIGDPRYQSVWSRLPESVTTGEPQAEAVHGVSMWELLDRDPDYAATFNEAMSRLTALYWPTVAAAYDFIPFQQIVDVSGEHGQLLASIQPRRPARSSSSAVARSTRGAQPQRRARSARICPVHAGPSSQVGSTPSASVTAPT